MEEGEEEEEEEEKKKKKKSNNNNNNTTHKVSEAFTGIVKTHTQIHDKIMAFRQVDPKCSSDNMPLLKNHSSTRIASNMGMYHSQLTSAHFVPSVLTSF